MVILKIDTYCVFNFLEEHKKNPKAIIGFRGRQIKFDRNKK